MQNIIPFVDKDGIWKAKERLENARDLPQELRNPNILSNDQPLVKLLLQHYHQKLAHCGYKRSSLSSNGVGTYPKLVT